MMKKIFLASADHKVARFTFREVMVDVKPSPGHPGFWYAWLPGLGCSKDFADPKSAAASLFHDHCCTNLTLKELPNADQS
jgi:hypothetical protein